MSIQLPTYNKLVQDKIPQIIKQEGKKFEMINLSKEDYYNELKKKIIEEIDEYLNTTNKKDALKGLADVLEVLRALV